MLKIAVTIAVSHWRGLLASQLLIPKMSPPSKPKWRNGRRAGFKIPYPLLGVWVRLPPSALFANDLKNPGSSGVFAFLVVAVFGSVDCDAGGSV